MCRGYAIFVRYREWLCVLCFGSGIVFFLGELGIDEDIVAALPRSTYYVHEATSSVVSENFHLNIINVSIAAQSLKYFRIPMYLCRQLFSFNDSYDRERNNKVANLFGGYLIIRDESALGLTG